MNVKMHKTIIFSRKYFTNGTFIGINNISKGNSIRTVVIIYTREFKINRYLARLDPECLKEI